MARLQSLQEQSQRWCVARISRCLSLLGCGFFLVLSGAPPSLYIGGWISGTVSEGLQVWKGTDGFLIYLIVLVEFARN